MLLGDVSSGGSAYTGGDVVGRERIVLRRALGQVLAPLDGEGLAQGLCVEDRDENLIAGVGRSHGVDW